MIRQVASLKLRPTLVAFACMVFAAPAGLAQTAPTPPRQGNTQGEAQPENRERRQRGDRENRGSGGGMFGRMGDAPISATELERYASILGLTESQKAVAKDLHEAYLAETEEFSRNQREAFSALREEARDDPSVFSKMGEMMQAARAKRQAMESAFLTDMKATLAPEQQGKWESVERTRRRDRSMSRGLMAGERLDVVRMVEALKLSPEQAAAVTPVLDQYEIDVDRELVVRNQVFDKAQEGMREVMGGGDLTKMQEMFEQGRAAAMKVRDVNRRYARQIEAQLPEEKRAAFAEAVRRQSYPMIYRPSQTSRLVEAVNAMADMTGEQKQTITEINERFTREYAAVSQQLEVAQNRVEENLTAQNIMAAMGGGRGGGGGGGGGGVWSLMNSPEAAELRTKRRDLDQATAERIQAVLTPEQRAKLPERNARDGGGGGEPPRRQRRGGGAGPEQAPPNQRI